MPQSANKSLVVCYISGFDLRRIDAKTTPFFAEALSSYPWTEFTNLPSNELFPTLVTGVDPTKHRVWGVKRKPTAQRTLASRLVDRLPNLMSTTIQGCLHLLTGNFDLAAIPPRRRRQFEITRTKYKRRSLRTEALSRIGGQPSVFDVVGRERSRYVFDSGYDPARRLCPRLCHTDCLVEFVELYSLDRMQQWNLDRSAKVLEFYTHVDEFLGRLHDKCQGAGKTLMVVSDHGHEPIRKSVDLFQQLAGLALPEESYTCFVEVSSARFWFHTEPARQAVTAMLSNVECGTLLHFSEMAEHGLPFVNGDYGEYFCFLDPGVIFFPHDFHNPLANLWLGLADRMQRSRLRDPRHKGNHGHLPHFDAERSFVGLLDAGFETNGRAADILDVAPSILGVLGFEPPGSMPGRPLFREKASC